MIAWNAWAAGVFFGFALNGLSDGFVSFEL